MIQTKYRDEISQTVCSGKTVTVHNLSPVFPGQEEAKAKAEISNNLYTVFSKYQTGKSVL